MSLWGYRSRLGDARLTRAAMDVTAHGHAVARAMFFGAPAGGGVTASLAATVGLALVASGSVAVAATATRTLASPALTGSTSIAIAGSGALTVGAPGLAADGGVAVGAGLSRLLGLSLAADASVKEGGPGEVSASLTVTLPGFALAGLVYATSAVAPPDALRPVRRVATQMRPRRLRSRRN